MKTYEKVIKAINKHIKSLVKRRTKQDGGNKSKCLSNHTKTTHTKFHR